jgi:hypothetical protein
MLSAAFPWRALSGPHDGHEGKDYQLCEGRLAPPLLFLLLARPDSLILLPAGAYHHHYHNHHISMKGIIYGMFANGPPKMRR